MVSAKVYGYGDDIKIYILPYPINKRMNFPDTIKTIENLSKKLGNGRPTKLFIESVYYQKSVIQELRKRNFPAEEVLVLGQDKKARLETITPVIENGIVLFPEKGAEILINQLTGFGSEKYDDLADAFAMLIGEIMKENNPVYHLTDGMANSGRGNTIIGNLMNKEF